MANASAKRRTTTVTETEEAAREGEEEEVDEADAPLFGRLDRDGKKIEVVAIHRKDPDSGYLGTMSPDMTEASLAGKWGGGSYRLEAKNAAGVVRHVRTVKLAGDPLFSSESEERKWRRMNGLAERPGAGDSGALSVKDLILVIEEKDERRRAELLEREDRARKEAADREERDRRVRDEMTARNQKDADDREDRRQRQAREDEERRTRAHREDMERLAAQNAAQLAQAQQFFTQLATTMKADASHPAPDPVKNLLAGMQIAREFAGGGEEGGKAKPADFMTTLMDRLPETLQEVRRTAGAVHAEITRKTNGGPRPAAVPKGTDYLTITGPTATKAKAFLKGLLKAGKNPEVELNRMLGFAAAAMGPPAAAAAPPATSTKAAAAPAAAKRAAPARGPRGRVARTKQIPRRARAVARTKQIPPGRRRGAA